MTSSEQDKHIELMRRLQDPFEESEIEWKVQTAGVSKYDGAVKPWILVVPYVTSRGVQDRLDSVFSMNWSNVIKEVPNQGFLCGLKVKVGDVWIERMDGAEYSKEAAFKGGISGSLKRSSVLFGIGRYLYKMNGQFPPCKIVGSRRDVKTGNYHFLKENKKKGILNDFHIQWVSPKMPLWALPHVEADDLIKEIKEAADVIELKVAFTNAYNYATSFKRSDLIEKMKIIKDTQKALFEKESEAEDKMDYGKFQGWFERKVTEVILGAGNESVLKIQFKSLKEEVLKESKERNIEPKETIDSLNKYYRKKLNSLTTL